MEYIFYLLSVFVKPVIRSPVHYPALAAEDYTRCLVEEYAAAHLT